ncbi:MAG: 2-oxoacid:acceptor oxidoreductase family protein [Deltaproteobacteria bacterium]|nr:2-oxoacid:acceptor oxidoreductase family protein [Deltaproteobacteria bacterium]MBN2674329.1 2-oxoacid:acceptor oxidoreductase family protein [Deltaproteobacteria bacterium]
MSKTDIRICGMGGQGVIMSGMVIGKAASIYQNKWSTMIQSFGPEARGSTCAAQVMIAESPIGYPYIRKSDVFMVFSQAGYEKYVNELKPEGMLVYEDELVTLDERVPGSVTTCGIPATRIAQEQIGKVITFNMVMLGFLAQNSNFISFDAIRKSIIDSVPKGTEETNLKAFDAGYTYEAQEQ